MNPGFRTIFVNRYCFVKMVFIEGIGSVKKSVNSFESETLEIFRKECIDANTNLICYIGRKSVDFNRTFDLSFGSLIKIVMVKGQYN